MSTNFSTKVLQTAAVALGALFLTISTGASTGDFYPAYDAKVVGHIAMSGGQARQMFLQHEDGRSFLYVRLAGQVGFTVIDVSKPEHPKVVSHIAQNNLAVVDGDLAITEASAAPPRKVKTTPEVVRVLDVSDPSHPRTVQTFQGVTSLVRDDARRLIYVANNDGIWILSHRELMRRHFCTSSDAISSAMPNCN